MEVAAFVQWGNAGGRDRRGHHVLPGCSFLMHEEAQQRPGLRASGTRAGMLLGAPPERGGDSALTEQSYWVERKHFASVLLSDR